MSPVPLHEKFAIRDNLAQLVRDLEDVERMMRQEKDAGVLAAATAVGWAVTIAGLDAARKVLSKDPRVAAAFTAEDHLISIVNSVLQSFRRAPMLQKSDLLNSLPPNLRLANLASGSGDSVKKMVELPGKVLTNGLKVTDYLRKNEPAAAVVLNVQVLRGYLWKYQNKLTPFLKKVSTITKVVDASVSVVEDGALILSAYETGRNVAHQADAALRHVSLRIATQRSKLNQLDREITYEFEQMEMKAHTA